MYQKSIYYLHAGDDDDEITVVKLVEVEFVNDDTNDTEGFDTVDGVELTTISIKYIYIIKNLYFYFFTIT